MLVLQHEPELSAGLFGEWSRERGFELEVRPAQGGWELPDLSDLALICSLGSHDHAFDDAVPWLGRELELLRRAHDAGLPVLGICFGSQALARALGAATGPSPAPEVGWLEAEAPAPEAMPAGPWIFWHEDQFEVPRGGELLARTGIGPAAFRLGSSVGVQFHPELTEEGLEQMIRTQGAGVDPAVLEQMRAGIAAEPEKLRERAWRLYDGLIAAAETVAVGAKENRG
ncbi:MAG TPA: type 1 glutamine amidotransferase [Solirubrobacterales bacterium]|nr:type 1 glutamine amidotransferase [Solirubrobacterales bacterium]